jgi:alpha-methylacyl-CoA racemase
MATAMLAGGALKEQRAANLLDGGAPFYDLYETADGRHMTVGALEPKFYEEFVTLLGIKDEAPDRYDLDRLGELRELIARTFRQKTLTEWAGIFDGTDACVAPVLTISEAARDPHIVARGSLVEHEGVIQPAPAPRFSRTEATLGTPPTTAGAATVEALEAWGVKDVIALVETGAAVQA